VLKKAFSGQLVSQNATDEPASTLLSHITAEKATLAAEGKGKRAGRVTRTADIPITDKEAQVADLLTVLRNKASWTSTTEVIRALGIINGATTDELEEFYLELRILLNSVKIEVDRRGDEDWLRAVEEKAR
jgi:type I restriction enzyme S subunit